MQEEERTSQDKRRVALTWAGGEVHRTELQQGGLCAPGREGLGGRGLCTTG